MTLPLLVAALFQTGEAPPLDPPVGSTGEYQLLALAVRQATAKDPSRAARLAGLLPRRDPALYWDDRKVPAVSRAAFIGARDFALAQWGQYVAGFKPKIVPTAAAARGGLVFSFEPRLANGAGATHFLGQDSGAARLETVLGLRRGEFYTTETDVHNEVLFAVGTYLGVLPNPSFGGAMGRTDASTYVGTTPRSNEARVAEEGLVQSTALRKAIAKGQKLAGTRGKLWVESKTVDLGVRVQGQPAEASFTVANNGDGPMLLRVGGDCVCLSAIGPTRLEAGESGVVRARYDTSFIGGGIAHRVLIRTTDPDTPEVAVTMKIAVRTLARFIVPGTEGVGPATLAAEDGRGIDLYFVTDPSKPLKVRSARADGVEGTLTYEPWRGTLADPVLSEGALEREGYKFRFVPNRIPNGTTLLALSVQTEDGERHVGNVFLQKGLVVTPPSAGFPDLGTTPGRIEIALKDLHRPLRILSVIAEGSGVTAREIAGGGTTRRIAIAVDPTRVVKGQSRRILVQTDDPANPQIVIPVTLAETEDL